MGKVSRAKTTCRVIRPITSSIKLLSVVLSVTGKLRISNVNIKLAVNATKDTTTEFLMEAELIPATVPSARFAAR